MKALINNKNKLVIISESKEEDNLFSRWHDENWNRDFFYSAVEFRKNGSIIEPEIDESKVIHREPEMIKENKSRPDPPKPPPSRSIISVDPSKKSKNMKKLFLRKQKSIGELYMTIIPPMPQKKQFKIMFELLKNAEKYDTEGVEEVSLTTLRNLCGYIEMYIDKYSDKTHSEKD